MWYIYHMTIQDLAKQDSREIHDQDVRDVQALLAEVYSDDSIPYNVEVEDQDPDSLDSPSGLASERNWGIKEDAHLS